MRQSLLIVLIVLLLLLPLGGCANDPYPKVKLVRSEIPQELLSCPDAPKAPLLTSSNNDADLANYIIALSDAGEGCREKIRKLNELFFKL